MYIHFSAIYFTVAFITIMMLFLMVTLLLLIIKSKKDKKGANNNKNSLFNEMKPLSYLQRQYYCRIEEEISKKDVVKVKECQKNKTYFFKGHEVIKVFIFNRKLQYKFLNLKEISDSNEKGDKTRRKIAIELNNHSDYCKVLSLVTSI